MDWAFNDAVRFRGGVQTAIRAPNINELFALQVNNFPSFVQLGGQARGIVGGNPDLDAERQNSFTVGLVLQPNKDLTFTADCWSIELKDVIAVAGATTIVQRCFDRDGANPTYSIDNQWCQLFNRNASDGGVIDLAQPSRNQAVTKVSGIDLAVDFGM